MLTPIGPSLTRQATNLRNQHPEPLAWHCSIDEPPGASSSPLRKQGIKTLMRSGGREECELKLFADR